MVLGALAAVLVPVATYLSARTVARTGRQANHTANWSAFSAEQREWMEDRLTERDVRIDQLAKDVKELRGELDTLMRKYRIAIAYIRRLVVQLQGHVPPDAIETPPPEITRDL